MFYICLKSKEFDQLIILFVSIYHIYHKNLQAHSFNL